MNPTELFDGVAEFLEASGYEVIVQQVREELDNGRLREERLNTLTEVKGQSAYAIDSSFRRGTTAEFVRREDYTPNDALVLLLEAARRGIIETREMAAYVLQSLQEDGLDRVVFASERPDDPGFSLDLAPKGTEGLAVLADKVDALIRQVRVS